MATDKRFVQSASLIDKDFDGSFQLPTTSANEDINNNSSNSNSNYNNNNNNISISSSNNESNLQHIHNRAFNSFDSSNQVNRNRNLVNNLSSNPNVTNVNFCQHQAATRSLLFNNHHSNEFLTATTTTTTDSEESVTPPPHYHEIPGIVPAYQGRTSGPPPAYDDVVNPNAPPPSYQSLFGQVREARKTSNGLVDLFRQLFLILIGTIGCTMIIGFLLLIPITMILVGIFYVHDCKAENIPTFLVIGGFVWIVKNVLNCYNQFKKDSSTSNRPPPRRTPISSSATEARIQQTSTHPSVSVLIVASASDDADNQIPNNNHNSQAIISSHNHYQSELAGGQVHQTTTATATTTRPTTVPLTATTRSRTRDQNVNHIRHPPMIGLTSYKCESILNYFLIVWFLAGCIVVYRIYEPDYENTLSASYCNRTVYLYAFWLMTSAFIIIAIVLSCLCCLMASSLMSCNHGR